MEPCSGAFDGSPEVPSISLRTCFSQAGSFDDLERPFANFDQCCAEFIACIAAIAIFRAV